MTDNIEVLRGAVARGWCSPENAGKTVDPALAEAIVQEVIAALTASCDARVGGECAHEAWERMDCGPHHETRTCADCGKHLGRYALATPAQPASECDACGGSGYTTRPSGNHACWNCATPAQPKASEGKAGGEAVAFAIQGPDGTISMLGWMPMRHREALQNLCVLTPGARFVYAYANLNLPETDDA